MGLMKKVILSFDDGYEEDYKVVFPILKEKGIVATSYVITNDVGRNGYLSWENMREMADYGWDFQCHTHHHEMLTKLDNEEIERDIRISKNEFFRRCFTIPEHCAYPFGEYNERVKGILKKHFKSIRGGAMCDGGDHSIKSFGIHGNHDINELLKENILFLHTHDVSDNHRGFGVSPKKFKEVINLLLKANFEFITIKDYIDNKPKHKKDIKKGKKAVIMAAGSAKRWGNYLNVPKQLIEVDGEPILHRTIRLLKENDIDDIYVTVPEKGYYGKLDAKEIVGSSDAEINKFLNAKEHIGAIFLWGDTYFSDNAIRTITNNEEDLMFFGNANGNKYTGKPYGEIYAVKTNELFFQRAIEMEKHRNQMTRCASWELYGYILTGSIPRGLYSPHKSGEMDNGFRVRDPKKTSRYFTEIYDFTDDFDYPKDYDKWIEKYNRYFLNRAWSVEPKKKFTFSYNIMAHPSRKELAESLSAKLGVDIIWDKSNNIWDTRKMCLRDHISKGKDFGITIQDDSIVCPDFKGKAEHFVSQIGNKEAIYNFFHMKYLNRDDFNDAIKRGDNCFEHRIKGITSELCFAFPTHLMEEMIDTCDKSKAMSIHVKGINREGDWIMDERYVKQSKLRTYFCVPSLVEHRYELESLFYPKGYLSDSIHLNRRASWFYGDIYGAPPEKKTVIRRPESAPEIIPGARTRMGTPGRKFKLVGDKIVPR